MKEIKLFEISNPKQWKNLPSKELLEEGFPVYGANGIIGSYHEYTHEKPTIAITCRGATSGTINKTLPKSFITSNAMVLDDLKENTIYIDYLFYALKNRGFNDVITGSAQPQITRESLKNVSFKIPKSYEDQIKIANLLERIENLITERQNTIDLLNELVKATFHQMFGDPVKNEKGWNKYEIKEIGKVITGNTPKRNIIEYYNSTYIEWIKTDNIDSKKVYLTNSAEYLSEKGLKVGRYVNKNALLINCIAGSLKSIGKVALANRKVAFNQQINAIEFNSNIDSLFMYWHFKISENYIQSFASGAMKYILSKTEFEKIKITVPSYKLQNKFATIAQKIESIKAEQEAQKKVMEELYASITRKVFNEDDFDLSRVPFDASLLPKEEDLVVIKKEVIQQEKLPKEKIKKPEIVNYKRKETETKLKGLNWENISFEVVANEIKEHYQQDYFNSEMLLRYLTEDLGIQVNYFSSVEEKKNPQLENADDFHSFIASALIGENYYLDLQQVFYNAEEENIEGITFTATDLESLSKKDIKDRSGIYFYIKDETITR